MWDFGRTARSGACTSPSGSLPSDPAPVPPPALGDSGGSANAGGKEGCSIGGDPSSPETVVVRRMPPPFRIVRSAEASAFLLPTPPIPPPTAPEPSELCDLVREGGTPLI